MFGSVTCLLDRRHEHNSIAGGGLFLVGVAWGGADLHAETAQRRSPMDEVQCEREGPVMSEEMESGVDLINNHAGSNQIPAHLIQNRTQDRPDGGQRAGVDSSQQDSLNNNAEKKEEDMSGQMKAEEEDDEDDVMVDEEEDSSVTRGQSPDTLMTESSSDTASLVELRPSVSPETPDPISPEAGSPDYQSYSDSERPSTTEQISSQALLANLQGLAEHGDHYHLPQDIHRIAEDFAHQGDYERAVWCIQLETLYHQRLLHNLTTLQEQWERRCRSDCKGQRNSKSDLVDQQLEGLTNICRTHKRPSSEAQQCEVIALVLDEVRPSTINSGQLVERVSGLEEGQRRIDPGYSQDTHTIRSAGGAPMDRLCSNDTTDLVVSQDCRDSVTIRGFHRDDLIDGSFTKGEGREPLRQASGQQADRELEHTILEGSVESDSPTGQEMSRPKPEEQQGGEEDLMEEEEEVEEAEDALALVGEEVEEEQKREGGVCLKASLEVSVLTVKEQLTALEVQQVNEIQLHVLEGPASVEYDQEEDMFDVEMVDPVKEEGASLDDLAKHITVEEMSPVAGLVSILKRRSVGVEGACVTPSSSPPKQNIPAKRRVRFKEPEDGFDQDEVGVDSCLLLFLLCLITVVISLGGTALYCALGDAHSTVCTDFSRNADFYLAQLHHGMGQLRHWLTLGS
ncbi:hypothetical protein UPYG_G00225580 [Umbra pygmaea]|uniref:Consortin C-terminal domain-containing protein n=1 Tax=Umbra pygmaea TaxID=75934 RepID=A0ABD0WCE3_UMBPY